LSEFVRVGKVEQFRAGRGRQVTVAGQQVAVFRTPAGLVAVSDACPHMGASLADGRFVEGRIECGWHGWRYDVETGQSDRREWACVAVYEVKIEAGEVYLRKRE
jgi:nitrite reductase (NADH) small subunit/3-phenylpropionate/trans-cinnamate dioxygenase ferredoxin subunit